ncbi:MAG: 2-oxoglutarate dehydrogenase complex dihydrolipoyllysine-residue succinyltransferase [Planctomycetaceae bacterium]|nr:2-oxoglutarate dehydrogenase complex dihydrolipoyllysine-residue succinyltransferase [Planctomycetaceae bacterium]
MAIELKVPAVGESITEVQIGTWHKKEGDQVAADEPIVEIESDKATVELPAPAAGVLGKILVKSGQMANVDQVIGTIEPAAAGAKNGKPSGDKEGAKPAAKEGGGKTAAEPAVMPAAKRVLGEAGVDESSAKGSGPGGRVLKEDAERAVSAAKSEAKPAAKSTETKSAAAPARAAQPATGSRDEEVVPMSMLRRRIAERLVSAQANAALLTTFNEIDMTAAKELRARHGEAFLARHGVKLGFMSLFVKASVDALRLVPQVNAEVRGTDIVYKHYNDIGIAVGGGRGLVVPILRNAEALGLSEIEKGIADFGARAKDNRLELEELQGGTFTISNGGIYGSLLSTPIVNPPQSGILGLHAIQDRPVAIGGQVVIRPMMYVALSYDHRLVDGREAVTFLKRIKDCMEDPARMLLEV